MTQDILLQRPLTFTSSAQAAWQAIRVKTLLVAFAVIILGQSLAWYDLKLNHSQSLDYFLALMILTCCLFLQISVNLTNDYFDGLSGIDTTERVGPQRVIQSGLIKPRTMRYAIALTVSIACVCGLYLIIKGGWVFLFLGLLSLFGVYAYSGGKKPLASLGLGEVAVFLYFGYLAIMASYVLQIHEFNTQLFLPATQMGFLIAAIMLINNIRDIKSDKAAGKNTLAIRIGEHNSRWLYCVFITIPFVLIPFDSYQPYYNFLLMPAGIFLCIKIYKTKNHKMNNNKINLQETMILKTNVQHAKIQGDLFNKYLGLTTLLVFAWSVFYSTSLIFF
jgi:1,4-dihydroxy-2-naphthoate octaprenyltransferase